MNSISRFYSVVIFTVITYCVHGQNYYQSYAPHLFYDTADAGKVSIHFYNNNFVKNNEYFGPYTEGMTFIGSVIQPEVTWTCSKNFSLSGGWYFRQFYGYDGFQQSLPVIRARYSFLPGANLIIGQLDGQRQHGYIEPLYSEDNYFIKNPEYGVQMVLDRRKFSADLFMDWEKFLMPGDSSQEQIAGGLLASYSVNNVVENHGLSFHFQSIIHHYGGQVDNSDAPLQSRANLAAGLKYVFSPTLTYLNKIILSSWYIHAMELSQTNTLPYESGNGYQNTIGFENKWIKINTGWFHGEQFFAPLGDYLFQSVSQYDPGYSQDKRDLIISKFLFNHEVIRGVDLGIRFESYYDLLRKVNDFSYGVNISVNAEVFKHPLNAKLK